jgi:hypothetical protein
VHVLAAQSENVPLAQRAQYGSTGVGYVVMFGPW